MDVVTENVRIASQECLLSSSGDEIVALERFLHEKLDVLNGLGLKKVVEVDPSGILALSEQLNVGHRDIVDEVVERHECLRLSDMDRILRSELVEGSSRATKRLSSGEDVTVLGGPPPKSNMLKIAGQSAVNELTGREFCSVANLGHSFLSSSQFDGTGYATSEFDSMAPKTADEITEVRGSVSDAIDVLSVPRGETQHGLGKGLTKFYPSYSARTLLKDCFAENPTTLFHRH